METIKAILHNTEMVNLVTILAGLGTFISAVIAAWTVVEIKRQRRSSYMPDLVLETHHARWCWNKILEVNNYFIYQTHVGYEKITKDDELRIPFYFKNIGLGVAKFIKVDWEFNSDLALKVLKDLLPSGFELGGLTSNSVSIKVPHKQAIWLHEHTTSPSSIDFVLPGTSLKRLFFPWFTIDTFLYCIIFKRKLHEPSTNTDKWFYERMEEFPPLIMTLRYQDFLGKSYTKRYKITFRFSPIVTQKNALPNEIGELNINVEEISNKRTLKHFLRSIVPQS